MRPVRIIRSGAIVEVEAPGADPRLTIEDLAWALHHTIRWGGHSARPVSVAQHSIAMCREATDYRSALACLWHDAAEVFVGDMTTLVKHHPDMLWYRSLEAKCFESLIQRFAPNLIGFDWPSIKELDRMALRTEARMGFPETADFLAHEHFQGPGLDPECYCERDDHQTWLDCLGECC